jgi:alpha-beta hydrolase superfamily lysophospholipase
MVSFASQSGLSMLLGVFIVLVLLLVLNGCSTLRSAKPWHKTELQQEFRASMVKAATAKAVLTGGTIPAYRWSDYLAQEEKLFAELRAGLHEAETYQGYRFDVKSPLNPLNQTHNWNRSFVLTPEKIRAGIVMIHGLTDSPYSVRSLANSFAQQGFLVIALRVPGHGTLPSGLLNVRWRDWTAATQLAAEEMQRRLGHNPHFYILGYSNGGTLALNYTLDALQNPQLPQPKKVILLSPMIGISKFAGLSKPLEWIGQLPLLSSRRWLSKSPEYNPFKYNSFPVNAAWQAHRFSRHVQFKIQRLAKQQRLKHLPPVLGFQSVVDATVSTAAIEEYFYRYLPANHSELVLFDINRHQDFLPITRTGASRYLTSHFAPALRNYDLVKIANRNADTMEVSEWRQPAGRMDEQEQPLGLEFPAGVFSLSHVALPFAMTDPLYGLTPSSAENFGIRLGNRQLLGETNTLIIKATTGMRLYCNPFYDYMEARIFAWLDIESLPRGD